MPLNIVEASAQVAVSPLADEEIMEDEAFADDTIVIEAKSTACNKSGELYEHGGDCNKFAACEGGQIKTYNCPPGLHFNLVRTMKNTTVSLIRQDIFRQLL